MAVMEAEDEYGIRREAGLFKEEEGSAGSAATAFARLATIGARKGDRDQFRQYAMTASGLTQIREYPSSPAVFLELARGAALLGESDLARQYIEQSQTSGAERDTVFAEVIEHMARRSQVAEARRAIDGLEYAPARVRARYAVVHAEAAATSAKLSTLFEEAESCSDAHEKAAALAAVAANLLKKGDATAAPAGGKP